MKNVPAGICAGVNVKLRWTQVLAGCVNPDGPVAPIVLINTLFPSKN